MSAAAAVAATSNAAAAAATADVALGAVAGTLALGAGGGLLGRTIPGFGRADDSPSTVGKDAEEAALVERCLAGHVEAFRPLVQRYQRLVFAVALRMLGSPADAEDVAQQAFVDAFGALDRFQGEGRAHAFSTWLLRIAVNRSKDVLKSKKRTEEPLRHDVGGGEAVFAHDPSTPEANASGAERRRCLEQALLAVPTKYREVLVLKDIEELPYEEIRAILRLPITTLKIRVVRARAMLRDLVERHGGER